MAFGNRVDFMGVGEGASLEVRGDSYFIIESTLLYVLLDISNSYLPWSANFSFPATFYDEILRLMPDKLFSVCI